MARFPALLREAHAASGLSYRQLGDAAFVSRSHVHNIATGKRVPDRRFAEAVDIALGADGRLVAAFEADEAERLEEAATRKTLAASLAASRDLIDLAEMDLDQIHAGVAETAVDYLSTAPGPMLHRTNALRTDVLGRLRDHRHGVNERKDLLVAAGRLSGVLAYAALDLGDPHAALEHARAGARCAQAAGDLELLMWMRGTQSLIARFNGDYGVALDYVRDGLQYAGEVPGTGKARLLSGEAQCLANLGDSVGANRTLDAAERAHEAVRQPDSLAGLFEFSHTKRLYYSGSSLIWLEGGADAQRAERDALAAITSWQQMPPEQRSLDDERLAHVYVATARVQLGDIEGAAEVMRPILTLPPEAQISWINKRAGRVASMLSAPEYATSTAATELRDAITGLEEAPAR